MELEIISKSKKCSSKQIYSQRNQYPTNQQISKANQQLIQWFPSKDETDSKLTQSKHITKIV